MSIESILEIDWVTYVSAVVTLLVALCTVVDAFVDATPTKRDDEVVKPITSAILGFLSRFSLFRGKR